MKKKILIITILLIVILIFSFNNRNIILKHLLSSDIYNVVDNAGSTTSAENELINNLEIKNDIVITNKKTKVSELKSLVENADILKVFDVDNNEVADTEIIKTNYIIQVNEIFYKIAVLGDVMADGKITVHDLSKAYAAIEKNEFVSYNEIEKVSLDINLDNKIDKNDLDQIFNNIKHQKKEITVVYHRNINGDDTVTATQTFVEGETGNKFGYNNDGSPKWNQSGQFGEWDNSGYTLKGWTKTKGSNTVTYKTYANVKDTWIDSVNKNYDGTIHLYAVWYKNVDLVLFWGQSNMVGYVPNYDEEKVKDTRDLDGLIDKEIIDNYDTYGHVSVPVASGTGYEYRVNPKNGTNLVPITANTTNIGENVTYKDESYTTDTSNPYALQRSKGTNMIPQFIKTYNEYTGNSVVAVHAAHGGLSIAYFIPGPHNGDSAAYMYETMVKKYTDAEDYLINNGYEIKNKFYVVYQGCADLVHKRNREKYYSWYMTVHNELKKDLGLEFGAMVYVGHRATTRNVVDSEDDGKTHLEQVELFNTIQSQLISDNDDIILATDLPYKSYIGLDTSNNKGNIFSGYDKNSIHLTAAGLSQVGKNTAISVANSGKLQYRVK